MKTRIAGTFEGAILDIVRVLGIERCAEVVGKSVSLVRKWSDPDNKTLPSLDQALVLDLEYAREMRSMPPLLHSYSNRINKEFDACEDGEHVLAAMLLLQVAVCELGKGISAEFINPEQVTAMHRDHWQELLEQINIIMRKTRNVEISLISWHGSLDKAKLQKMSGNL